MAGLTDVMSLVQFQEELRRAARLEAADATGNPLSTAVQKIRDNPAFSQSRLLHRVLTALMNESGEFRRAEASAFDTATLRLVVALMNAAKAGTHTKAEWLEAVKAADAASV